MSLKNNNILGFVVLLACVYFAGSIAVMSVDLGSEWLKVAIVKPGVPMEVALNKESRRKTPFVVSLKDNERLFSDPALVVSVKQPQNAYIYLMHLLGKKYDSPSVQLYKKRFPFYKLFKDEIRGTVLIKGEDNQLHSVEELVAMVLNASRNTAENFADHPMKDCVLTVPVFFNQAERKAVLDASNMTGLNVLQLMNDNTAVALNYGIFRAATFNETVKHIMFFDMGSSHATATIVGYSTTKVKDKGYSETVPQLVVKGVGFDAELGGLEMDLRVRDFFVKSFKATNKLKNDITENPRAMAKLLKEAKRVRQVLSANADHVAQIENVFEEKNFRTKLTRVELEEMCHDLFEQTQKPVQMALDAAAMTIKDIDSVVLMGGATRIPKVKEKLLEITQKEELAKNINTDEAAALGSVYKAADLTAGFKVKRFLVKDLNLYPIDVRFFRSGSDPDEAPRPIKRNLYHRLNVLPMKKVMTFNKKPKDFDFNVTYGDMSFLATEQRSHLDLSDMLNVKLSGVDSAHEKNNKATSKGVKAYFHLDESGILHLEKMEAHFEKTPELLAEEEQSTFAKLGSKLSSFFGTSKPEETIDTVKDEPKSDEPSKDEAKKPEKEEESEKQNEEKKTETNEKSDASSNTTTTNNSTANANTTANANATEEVKPPKPVVVKETIQLTSVRTDIPAILPDVFQSSVDKLKLYTARDLAKLSREHAMNSFESFVYEYKEKLSNEEVQKLVTSDEKEKIETALNEASFWLDEEGYDADEPTFRGKLKDLEKLTEGLQLRLTESIERPKAIASMLQSLNISQMMSTSVKDMPDAKEIYTEKDLKDLEKVNAETKTWLMENWKKQNETNPSSKPVLLSKDIVFQQAKLDRELMYLINKAKYYVPKPKPKVNVTTATSNATKNSKVVDETEKKSSNETVIEDKPKNETKTEEVKEKEAVEEPILELGDGEEKTEGEDKETTKSETTSHEGEL